MEFLDNAQSRPLAFERFEAARHLRTPVSSDAIATGAAVKLSVAMAAHNEVDTIGEAISGVLDVDAPCELELIVVDDGSNDGTNEVIRSFDDPRLVVLVHPTRRGKGAALLSAAAVASGSHLLVFDADLEYSADDIPALLEPVMKGISPVVYGTRVPGMRTAFRSFRYALGSKATTVLANVLFDSWLTDMHTCLKLMPVRLFRELTLTEAGFGLDTEITAEMLRRGIRPFEVACSYRGRSFANGKKLSARDGLTCLTVLARVRLRGVIDYDVTSIDRFRVLPGQRAVATPGARPRGALRARREGGAEEAAPAAGEPVQSLVPVRAGLPAAGPARDDEEGDRPCDA